MTNRLLRALFANPDAWTWETLPSEQAMGDVSIKTESSAPVTALAV